MLGERLGRPNSDCEHSELVAAHFSSGDSAVLQIAMQIFEHLIQVLVHHCQKCRANGGDCAEK